MQYVQCGLCALESSGLVSNRVPPVYTTCFQLLFTCSLHSKGIDDANAESLAKGLVHCTNLQQLE